MRTAAHSSMIVLALGIASGLHAQPFADVAATVGVDTSHDRGDACEKPRIGTGSAWADYDGDGAIDLYLTDMGGPNRLYRNVGDGNLDGLPEFTNAATGAGVDLPGHASTGTVFIDYDNDGDQDLLVLGFGSNRLFANQLIESGSATFVDVTNLAGIADSGRAITAAWGDYDVDGFLDLYISKHMVCKDDDPPRVQDVMFHNNGDGTFTDVTQLLCAGPLEDCGQIHGLGFSPGWLDFDNDGDLDLYIVNDNIGRQFWPNGWWSNIMWRNDGPDGAGGWVFTDVSEETRTDINLNGMGLGIGDIDNDGWLDLAFSNIGVNYLLRNTGGGVYQDISGPAGIQRRLTPLGDEAVTWATAFFDYDNDTKLDLFIAGGSLHPAGIQPNAFFVNNGDLTFTDISETSGLEDEDRGRAASIADFDVDGYVDIMLSNYDAPGLLYHNKNGSLGAAAHWIRVQAEGTTSNRDGIGTRLTVRTPGDDRQVREISSGATHGGGDEKVAHFGLGEHTLFDLAVRWPNNQTDLHRGVDADQTLVVVEEPFVIADPVPGQAGEVNTFAITGAPPESEIRLVASPTPGIRNVPPCVPMSLALEQTVAIGAGMSDVDGNVSIDVPAPGGLQGRPIYVQALALDECSISARLRFVLD